MLKSNESFLLIDSSFYQQQRPITHRLLLFLPFLMNILLELPAKQITLNTPEALQQDPFLHLSLCVRSEGQATRIQTHWNRHGGI